MLFFRKRNRQPDDAGRAGIGPSIPAHELIYAVGDVHGRADLLDELFRKIALDRANRPDLDATVIMLGDLVDRGPESSAVIDLCLDKPVPGCGMRFILGNHEELMLSALDGNLEALRVWRRHGGIETMASYGLDDAPDAVREDELLARLATLVPARHLKLLRGMEDVIQVGDYAFVHAGVRPGVAIDRQKPADTRWIRDRFLNHEGDFGAIVVHGHSISEEEELRDNRIGIDTGAYASGRLTALALAGAERWFLRT